MKQRTRADLRHEHQKAQEQIDQLKQRQRDLHHEFLLLSDDEQQFVEEKCTIMERQKPEGAKRAKRVPVERTVGRVNWVEYFTDEDTGQKIRIDRSRIVRIDGKWIV